jgi:hypothetical protein
MPGGASGGVTGFGQPIGAICQCAYIVDDLLRAIPFYASLLRAGPWLIVEHLQPTSQLYRGGRTEVDVSIATAYSGSMMVELIQQNDELPSVYRETLDRSGWGFHHHAVTTAQFEQDAESYRARGYQPAFEVVMPPFMNSARVTYFDTTADLPGMVELIEVNSAVDEFFGSMKRAHDAWDGKQLLVR